jgi:hypothetical protein
VGLQPGRVGGDDGCGRRPGLNRSCDLCVVLRRLTSPADAGGMRDPVAQARLLRA